MADAALTSWSACALARAVAGGELGAAEIVDAHIARMEATHPHLNALVSQRFDVARAEARAIDARRARGHRLGALAGVPLTGKDSIDVAGLPSTFGLPWRAGEIAPDDDPCVERLRGQDAVVLGKSNVPQMLLYLESDNPLHGRTVNPWNPDRTCGGSSGGEAALLRALGQRAMAATLAQLGYTRVSEHWARIEALQDWIERFTAAMDQAEGDALDALICPPCGLAALRHGTARWLGLAGPYTLAFNTLGWPAGTLPLTTVRPTEESERPPSRDLVMRLARRCEIGSAGLPIGVQVVGRPRREDHVLALMKALEGSSQRASAPPLFS